MLHSAFSPVSPVSPVCPVLLACSTESRTASSFGTREQLHCRAGRAGSQSLIASSTLQGTAEPNHWRTASQSFAFRPPIASAGEPDDINILTTTTVDAGCLTPLGGRGALLGLTRPVQCVHHTCTLAHATNSTTQRPASNFSFCSISSTAAVTKQSAANSQQILRARGVPQLATRALDVTQCDRPAGSSP